MRHQTGIKSAGLIIAAAGVPVTPAHKLCPQYIWYMRQSFGS